MRAGSLGCCQKAAALSAWGSHVGVHHSLTLCMVAMAAAPGMDASDRLGRERVELEWIYFALIPRLFPELYRFWQINMAGSTQTHPHAAAVELPHPQLPPRVRCRLPPSAPATLTLLAARLAPSLRLSASLSLCSTEWCNKSRHVPAGHQQPDWLLHQRGRSTRISRGKPRKNDSARLENTAFTFSKHRRSREGKGGCFNSSLKGERMSAKV